MLNAVEEYPGQFKKMQEYIALLEKEIERMRNRIMELEAQVYNGSTK